MEYNIVRELNVYEIEEINGGDGECTHDGKEYSDGARLKIDDVVMTCSDGQWIEKS